MKISVCYQYADRSQYSPRQPRKGFPRQTEARVIHAESYEEGAKIAKDTYDGDNPFCPGEPVMMILICQDNGRFDRVALFDFVTVERKNA